MKIQLKRSNVLDGGKAKEPTAAAMEYGELAVNYNTTDPAVFIKDSADNIVKIADAVPPGDGALSIASFGSGDTSTGSFTANQSGASTLTLPAIRYGDLSGVPNFSGLYLSKTGPDTAAGEIQFGDGYSVSVRNTGKMTVKSSGAIVTYEGDNEPVQHRFDMDQASRESTGYHSPGSWLPAFIINPNPSANTSATINRYYLNTGGNQANAKALQANCKAANVDLKGGTTNSNNTPSAVTAGLEFTNQTKSSRFSFYNIFECISSVPGSTSAIDQVAAYYVNSSAFGYNDGTTDISLQNTIIKGFESNLTKDGTCGGSTKVWSNFHSGDAPSYYAGFIRAASGIDFSNSTTDLNANAEETLDRYERGTYTPQLNGSATTVSYSVQSGSYQIIGNICTAVAEITYSGASGSNQISITLPVAAKSYGTSLNAVGAGITFHNASSEIASPPLATTVVDGAIVAVVGRGGSRTQNYNSSRVNYNSITNAQVRFSITYTV